MSQENANSLENLQDRRTVDDLLECLLFMAKYYKRETSKESLIFGLPIHNNSMNYKMFCQASERIGFLPKKINRDLNKITKLALPMILFLENDRACILLDFDVDADNFKVIIPGLSKGVTTMSLSKLKSEYIGEAIIIKPEYDFRTRVDNEVLIEQPKEWFWGSLKRNTSIYKQVIIISIFINLFILATPMFTMNVYDRVLPNNALDTLMALGIGIFIVLTFDLIMKILRTYFLGIASKRADVIMSNRIFNHVLNIKINAKPASTGQFVSRLQSFESVREFFTSATLTTLVDFPFTIIFLLVIFYIGGPIVMVTLVTVIIAISIALYMQKPLKSVIEEAVKEEQIKQTTLIETVTGLEIIKSIRAQNRMRTHWDKSIAKTVESSEKAHLLSQVIVYITNYLSSMSNIVLVTYGVYLASEGDITMGAIIAAMILNGRVIAPVSQMVSMIIRFDRTMLSLENIDEIMKMPVEKEDKAYISRANLKGDIELKNVNFSYPSNNYGVLKNINIKIKHGEKIAILGKIGSGKSTLLKLIMNLYEPQEGSVLVDGIDTRQIDPIDLRGSMGVVPQEPFLFMGTIKDNITIGEQFATDEEVVKVSEVTGVNDFIEKHEEGFDLVVGERGEGLSGGEKQSVTLARALISNPNILMLDEPTNSLDQQSEKQFLSRIKSVMQDKTLLVVTHKTSLLELVDRVIIIDDGQVVTDDTKEKVFKRLKENKDVK